MKISWYDAALAAVGCCLSSLAGWLARSGQPAIGVLVLAAVLVAGRGAPAVEYDDPYDSGTYNGNFRAGLPLPGNFWFGATGAEVGLGYENSYMSVGGLVPLFDDYFFGTWILDARGHVSEFGDFFGNAGLTRRKYWKNILFGVNAWYDFDGDKGETYDHVFHQVGVGGEIVSEILEWHINGYLPVGTPNYAVGYPDTCFFQNNILIQQGVDAALGGVDTTFGFAVPGLTDWNAMAYVGGYSYDSSKVERIEGWTMRFEVTPLDSIDVLLQVNQDNRFDTTGSLSLVYHFGGSPRRHIGRAIDRPTQRNAHIVRQHQDAIYALNPDNGDALWRVIHVDNTAAAGGDGSYEHPVNTLAAADTAADQDYDIILVREGDGTTTGYDMGITLDNFQRLYGDGVAHTIATQRGDYMLCNDVDGMIPNITNPSGAAVLLANGNEVSGVNIDGAYVGILGNNFTDGVAIRDSVITGSLTSGIELNDARGNLLVRDSEIRDNGLGTDAGISVNNTLGTAIVNIRDNAITGNGTGVRLQGDGSVLTAHMARNGINDNRSNGIEVFGTGGADVDLTIDDNRIYRNGQPSDVGTGIRLFSTDATMTALISNNRIIDNAGDDGIPLGGGNVLITSTASVFGDFRGTGSVDLTIRDNLMNGAGTTGNFGFTLGLDYAMTTASLNTLLVENNNLDDGSSLAALMRVGGSTQLDAEVRDNSFDNNYHTAWELQAFGSADVRFNFHDNTVTNNVDPTSISLPTDQGVAFYTYNSARLIAYLTDNVIDNNRPVADFVNGVYGEANNTSTLVIEAVNNQISNNGDHGFELLLFDDAVIAALLRNNALTNNRAGDDFDLFARIDSGAGAGARICLELTSNAATGGYSLRNDSGMATFQYEDNASTGGFANFGNVILVPQGTCETFAAPLQVFP